MKHDTNFPNFAIESRYRAIGARWDDWVAARREFLGEFSQLDLAEQISVAWHLSVPDGEPPPTVTRRRTSAGIINLVDIQGGPIIVVAGSPEPAPPRPPRDDEEDAAEPQSRRFSTFLRVWPLRQDRGVRDSLWEHDEPSATTRWPLLDGDLRDADDVGQILVAEREAQDYPWKQIIVGPEAATSLYPMMAGEPVPKARRELHVGSRRHRRATMPWVVCPFRWSEQPPKRGRQPWKHTLHKQAGIALKYARPSEHLGHFYESSLCHGIFNIEREPR